MSNRTTMIVASAFGIGLVLCMALLIRQQIRLTELSESLLALSKRIESDIASVRDEIDAQASLSQAKAHPLTLAAGMYTLGPESEVYDEADTYTVYHATAVVGIGDSQHALQFGIARSGYTSWQVYFDYDSDGTVDTDILSDFVESIPFGNFVSGSLDAGKSQQIYERFLRSQDAVIYSSMDDVSGGSSDIAEQVWAFVSGNSAQLWDWIARRPESAAVAD